MGGRTRCLVSVFLSPGDDWSGVRAAAASSTPTLRPALDRGAWRVRGSPTPPELSLKLPAEKSPRDRWPSKQPSQQAVPTALEASGTRLPDPRLSGKSSVTRQVKNKELIDVSFFFFFPADAVLRSHHFRSEVIYLARTLKVRRSSLCWVPILIIWVFRSQ